MLLRKLLIIFTLFIFFNNYSLGLEIKIHAEIDNKIITNIDIENEIKYLILLNPKIKELNVKDAEIIAKNSLIKEIIKDKELIKFFDIEKKYKFVDKIERNLLLKRNIKKSELINLLDLNNMDYDLLRKKLRKEALWNQLVYKKYIKNIKINKEEMRKKIIDQFESEEKKYQYNLSEIVFEEKANEDYQTTLERIKSSIKNIGFENTANTLSIASTSNNGGLIGWINELQISEKLKNKVKKLKINEISEPMKIPSGYLIIKLNKKKEFNQKIDIEKELKNLIDNETNRQLNNFSIIFYKRLKQNAEINEY